MKFVKSSIFLLLTLFIVSCDDSTNGGGTPPPIVPKDVLWSDIDFKNTNPLPAPDGVTSADNVVVSGDNLTIEVNNMSYADYHTYIQDLNTDPNFKDKEHKIYNAADIKLSTLPITENKSFNRIFIDGDNYINVKWIDRYATDYNGSNFNMIITKTDPLNLSDKDIATDVLWEEIPFPNTNDLPTYNMVTKADMIIYDNSTPTNKRMFIYVKTMPTAEYNTYIGLEFGIQKDIDFIRHRSIPLLAGLIGIPGYSNDKNSATFVVTDNNSNEYISLNHIGTLSPAYANNYEQNFMIEISNIDPFGKGESTTETLSWIDATAKLPSPTTIPKPTTLIANNNVELATFADPYIGYEIRYNDVNYADFRTYLIEQRAKGSEFKGKDNPRGQGGLGFAFAVPEAGKDEVGGAEGSKIPSDNGTYAWAFIDNATADNGTIVQYHVSMIWNGKTSPNNPSPGNPKQNIFIIEVMKKDPMWFMPGL